MDVGARATAGGNAVQRRRETEIKSVDVAHPQLPPQPDGRQGLIATRQSSSESRCPLLTISRHQSIYRSDSN